MDVAEAKRLLAEGQFGETDMMPKIMAAIEYLEKVPNGKAIITSLDKTADVINKRNMLWKQLSLIYRTLGLSLEQC